MRSVSEPPQISTREPTLADMAEGPAGQKWAFATPENKPVCNIMLCLVPSKSKGCRGVNFGSLHGHQAPPGALHCGQTLDSVIDSQRMMEESGGGVVEEQAAKKAEREMERKARRRVEVVRFFI